MLRAPPFGFTNRPRLLRCWLLVLARAAAQHRVGVQGERPPIPPPVQPPGCIRWTVVVARRLIHIWVLHLRLSWYCAVDTTRNTNTIPAITIFTNNFG